jgi:hypothetical protein
MGLDIVSAAFCFAAGFADREIDHLLDFCSRLGKPRLLSFHEQFPE